MHAMPQTPLGRRALWLLLPVLLYILTPVYMLLDLLIPDSWRGASIAVVIVIVGLAVASLVTAGVAIIRDRDRSVVLVVAASLTLLLVITIAVGEAIGGH